MEKNKITEKGELRDARHVFKDRSEAGRVLAGMLENEYGKAKDALILAIPAGGVPVGLEISMKLKLPFDLMVVRKLQIPGNTEAGFGAMDRDGNVYLNDELLKALGLSYQQIETQKALVRKDIQERDMLFRKGKPFPDLTGRSVILVDDGIASGYTMVASIQVARGNGARSVVVAVPTAASRSLASIEPLADEIYCANVRTTSYFAVADAYKHWYDIEREEVLRLMGRD